MNFVDATLIRLADPATRVAVFDDLALGQILDATYETDRMPIEAPFIPVFDEFRLGVATPRQAVLEGAWSPAGSTERIEAHFTLSSPVDENAARVDAVWLGQIVARTSPDRAHITSVRIHWPDVGAIDSQIVAHLGALPADPTALEQARRGRLAAMLHAGLNQPATLNDDELDRLLRDLGVASVGDLIAVRGTALPSAVTVAFSPPEGGAPAEQALPIAAALLIRGADLSVTQLLADSQRLREQLRPLGLERPADQRFPIRNRLLVVWVVPLELFDDAAWPGGNDAMAKEARRAARRTKAGAWLAREGIGLVATN